MPSSALYLHGTSSEKRRRWSDLELEEKLANKSIFVFICPSLRIRNKMPITQTKQYISTKQSNHKVREAAKNKVLLLVARPPSSLVAAFFGGIFLDFLLKLHKVIFFLVARPLKIELYFFCCFPYLHGRFLIRLLRLMTVGCRRVSVAGVKRQSSGPWVRIICDYVIYTARIFIS